MTLSYSSESILQQLNDKSDQFSGEKRIKLDVKRVKFNHIECLAFFFHSIEDRDQGQQRIHSDAAESVAK